MDFMEIIPVNVQRDIRNVFWFTALVRGKEFHTGRF
jgi:hypothetical protein